jgi:hydroxymethylbilane synthase
MSEERVVIATRGSQLALWQAEHVKARIQAVAPGMLVGFNVIKTSGDKILDVPLAKVGGKGLFVKEIEQALIDGQADLAVHSMKDVPAELAEGLTLAAVSSREVPWDALCARAPVTVATLKQGAVVGTSSMRRQCQLLAQRPDLQIRMLRGNVPTRIRKLDDGEFDAIVLAAAGLTRLGMADRITQMLPIETSIPAVAQGVLAIETRRNDPLIQQLVRSAIHDAAQEVKIIAERAFLARMGGSCQTPLAAHATDRAPQYGEGGIYIVGMCGMPDGTRILRAAIGGADGDAQLLGERLADDLLAQGAAEILAATR